MKPNLRIALVFAFWGIMPLSLFAQRENLTKAMNLSKAGNINGAIEAIKEAEAHPATKSDIETFRFKSHVYKEIYKNLEKQYKASGLTPEKKEELKTHRLTAIESAKKANGMDKELKYAKELKSVIVFLATTFYNEGYDDFMAKDYTAAAKNYQMYISALKDNYPDDVDKNAYFNIGYAHFQNEKYDQAKEVFTQIIMEQFESAPIYYYLTKVYILENDKVSALRTVEAGTVKYPNDKDLLLLHANLLSQEGNTKELLPKMQQAVKMDPKNLDAKLVLATSYEKMAVVEADNRSDYINKAKDLYSEVIKVDPNNFTANYNLGIIIYNESVEAINNQSYDLDIFALDQVLDESTNGFKDALPYVLKANQLKPDNRNTLLALEGIYMNLNEDEKIFEVRDKLQQMDAAEDAAREAEENQGGKKKKKK